MKTELMNTLKLGLMVTLIENCGDNKQYSKELIEYLDRLHNKIRTLEMHLEQISDISKKYI